MATTPKEKDIVIKEHTITVQRMVTDDSLITEQNDHSFSLVPGKYSAHIDLEFQAYTGVRILDITEKTDPITVEYSSSHFLRGEISAEKGKQFLIQFMRNGRWDAVQTLEPSQYNITLTLQPPKDEK